MKMEDLKKFVSLEPKERICCPSCGHLYDGTIFSICVKCASLNRGK